MKRSRSTMELESKDGLTISPILFLKCECCGKSVMEYKLCGGNMIYCSIDCQEVLILSQKNGYLDQNKEKTFDEDIMSDVYYDSHLRDYDSNWSVSEYDSNYNYDSDCWSMNNPEECAEAFHAAAQMIEDMEKET